MRHPTAEARGATRALQVRVAPAAVAAMLVPAALREAGRAPGARARRARLPTAAPGAGRPVVVAAPAAPGVRTSTPVPRRTPAGAPMELDREPRARASGHFSSPTTG